MPRSGILLVLAAMVAAQLQGLPASAQSYPERPVTLVVPFAPGGSTSIVARAASDKMSEALGQKIIIDNRAGAGGTIGTKAVANSASDGTPSSPEEYAAFLDKDEKKWPQIIKTSGAKAE